MIFSGIMFVHPDRCDSVVLAVLHPTTCNSAQVAQYDSPRRIKGQTTHHDGIYAVREIVVHKQEGRDHRCSSSGRKDAKEGKISSEITCI